MIKADDQRRAMDIEPVELTEEQMAELDYMAGQKGFTGNAVLKAGNVGWCKRMLRKVLQPNRSDKRLTEFISKGQEVEIFGRRFKVYGIGRREIELTPIEGNFVDLVKGQEVELVGIRFKIRGTGKKLVLRTFSKKELAADDSAAEQENQG
jgi:hypothetical protein